MSLPLHKKTETFVTLEVLTRSLQVFLFLTSPVGGAGDLSTQQRDFHHLYYVLVESQYKMSEKIIQC